MMCVFVCTFCNKY